MPDSHPRSKNKTTYSRRPIRLFFGNKTTVDIAATGEAAFKGQLYQCQLVQAVVLKQIYEAR